jgi:hypothetical protein
MKPTDALLTGVWVAMCLIHGDALPVSDAGNLMVLEGVFEDCS